MNEDTKIQQRAIVARVTEAMDERQMGVSALARAAGVPRSTLQGWLTTGNPTAMGLQSIANALNVDLFQLVREPAAGVA